MRLAFLGSPDFAVPSLNALIEAGHEIACVYSRPPRPAGRGQTLRETPVHRFALERGIEVRTPKGLKKAEAQEAFAALKLDVAVVVAYGLILPKPILEAPRLGCINLHGSLLPRWRGAAPIQRALMTGDRLTGVQTMQMEEGLDTGPIYDSAETAIEADDTFASLHDRLAALGAPLLVKTLAALENGSAHAKPQSEDGMVYAPKITPAEARIDWSKPAREVDWQIRGLSPFPGAWFEHDGVRVKALMSRLSQGEGAPGEALDDELKIACGEGAVRLLRVQRAGKAAMDADVFLRGTPISAGARFS
ncbi:MAG: methionyl-tRNA formyltransferase [Caulobacterales bacterium]